MATHANSLNKGQSKMKFDPTKAVQTLAISKKIKHPDGSEVKRKGIATFKIPTNNAELAELGENAWKWAAQGIRNHVRLTATNAVTGEKDKNTKQLLRDFNSAMKTFVEVMEMTKADAFTFALGKKVFAPLVEYFENLKKAGETTALNYSDELPVPRWFVGEDDEDEEEADEEGTDENPTE